MVGKVTWAALAAALLCSGWIAAPAGAQATAEWGSGCGGQWVSSGECFFTVAADPVAFGGIAHAAALPSITVQVVLPDDGTWGEDLVLAECSDMAILGTEAACGGHVFTGLVGWTLKCKVFGNEEGLFGCASDP